MFLSPGCAGAGARVAIRGQEELGQEELLNLKGSMTFVHMKDYLEGTGKGLSLSDEGQVVCLMCRGL